MKKYLSTYNLTLFVLTLTFIIVSHLTASTILPNVDEAWFTLPGYNLAQNGFFGTTVLDESSTFRQVRLDGINQYTYWIMPVFPLMQGFWGKLVGFGLMETRSVSIVMGALALISWAALIKILSHSTTISLLAAGLMAVDYHFVYAGSLGRMDMAAVSLGITGLAVFAWLREKNFNFAVLFASALSALAFFIHPLGLLWLVSLAILVAMLDRNRISIRHFALAGLPYLLLGLGWLAYILQRPDLFLIQFGGNASNRWGFFRAPIGELLREIQLRYLVNFGMGEGLSSAGQIKIFILVACILAIAGILLTRSLRSQVIARFLLLIAAQEFIMLLFLDGMKQAYYMIYITPALTSILAVWLHWVWTGSNWLKPVAAGIFVAVIAIDLGVDALRIRKDPYHANYLSTGNFLNRNVQETETVMASAEFWFVLDRKDNLIDDYRLGFTTQKRADFIVIDASRYRDWHEQVRRNEPETYQYIVGLLGSEYQVVYEDSVYQIYKRIGKSS